MGTLLSTLLSVLSPGRTNYVVVKNEGPPISYTLDELKNEFFEPNRPGARQRLDCDQSILKARDKRGTRDVTHVKDIKRDDQLTSDNFAYADFSITWRPDVIDKRISKRLGPGAKMRLSMPHTVQIPSLEDASRQWIVQFISKIWFHLNINLNRSIFPSWNTAIYVSFNQGDNQVHELQPNSIDPTLYFVRLGSQRFGANKTDREVQIRCPDFRDLNNDLLWLDKPSGIHGVHLLWGPDKKWHILKAPSHYYKDWDIDELAQSAIRWFHLKLWWNSHRAGGRLDLFKTGIQRSQPVKETHQLHYIFCKRNHMRDVRTRTPVPTAS